MCRIVIGALSVWTAANGNLTIPSLTVVASDIGMWLLWSHRGGKGNICKQGRGVLHLLTSSTSTTLNIIDIARIHCSFIST